MMLCIRSIHNNSLPWFFLYFLPPAYGLRHSRLHQKMRTQHSLSYSFRLGSGIAFGSRIRKSSLCPRARTHKAGFDPFFRPLVRFTRFNRIKIWSLQVNANILCIYLCLLLCSSYYYFDCISIANVINIRRAKNTFYKNISQAALFLLEKSEKSVGCCIIPQS